MPAMRRPPTEHTLTSTPPTPEYHGPYVQRPRRAPAEPSHGVAQLHHQRRAPAHAPAAAGGEQLVEGAARAGLLRPLRRARLLNDPRRGPCGRTATPGVSATAMRFDELASYLEQLEATSSRNELVRILSELYSACAPDEIEPITYLIQGRLASFFVPVEIGLGDRLLLTGMAQAYDIPRDDVIATYRRIGDNGATAREVAPQTEHQPPAVVEVHRRLSEIAAAAGAGSLQRKLDLFAG